MLSNTLQGFLTRVFLHNEEKSANSNKHSCLLESSAWFRLSRSYRVFLPKEDKKCENELILYYSYGAFPDQLFALVFG